MGHIHLTTAMSLSSRYVPCARPPLVLICRTKSTLLLYVLPQTGHGGFPLLFSSVCSWRVGCSCSCSTNPSIRLPWKVYCSRSSSCSLSNDLTVWKV
ncbi:hypothetical protein OF83DRAFT_1111235 [Amylostereum chailletii]|nr:hypothetical protein OF83DRAFT_1111235 [Amylostereum chailletii]